MVTCVTCVTRVTRATGHHYYESLQDTLDYISLYVGFAGNSIWNAQDDINGPETDFFYNNGIKMLV